MPVSLRYYDLDLLQEENEDPLVLILQNTIRIALIPIRKMNLTMRYLNLIANEVTIYSAQQGTTASNHCLHFTAQDYHIPQNLENANEADSQSLASLGKNLPTYC